MTTMTRMITVLLTLALCAALFTGCGGGSSVDLKNAKSLADLKGAKIAAQTPRAIHIHDGRVLEPADENEVVI